MKIIDFKKISNIFHSLRMQLILYYMVVSLVILSVGAYISYSYILDMLKKNNEKYLLQQFSQAEYNIQNLLKDVDKLSKIFLLDDNIQQFLQDNYNISEFDNITIQKSIVENIGQFISNYDYLNSIFIFNDNKTGIGASERSTSIIRKDNGKSDYFESKIYKKVKAAYPKAILEGGISQDFYNNYQPLGKTFLISVARVVKSTYEPRSSGILVFNINEKNISSIYANSTRSTDGSMFIVDENGKIISSSDNNNIGKVYNMFSAIDMKKVYGSFTADKSSTLIQGVYYKMKDINLYLVEEIPLQYFTKDIIVLKRVIAIVLIVSFFAISIVTIFWLRKLTRPLNIIAAKMREVSRGSLGLTFSRIPKNEFGIVIKRFNEMSLSIVDLIKKNDEIQEQKRKLEIETLQSQINPHFLYNTLNMIKWMAAGMKAKNIVDCVIALGNMLKPLFKSSEPMCSVKEEMEYIENYLKIINWRFNNNVDFTFNIEECFLVYKIPRFIIQPIIENSITHGIDKQGNKIHINIDIYSDGNTLQLIVFDTGTGIEAQKIKEINNILQNSENGKWSNFKGSIGLSNVNRRIRLNFGTNYGVTIQNTMGRCTRVIVKIPTIL